MIPIGDQVALADAIAQIAGDDDTRKAMGQAARSKALVEFDERRVIDVTLAIYDRLLATGPPSAR